MTKKKVWTKAKLRMATLETMHYNTPRNGWITWMDTAETVRLNHTEYFIFNALSQGYTASEIKKELRKDKDNTESYLDRTIREMRFVKKHRHFSGKW